MTDSIVGQAKTLADLGKVFSVNDTWRCDCGAEHGFGSYACGHWNIELVHKCTSCGTSRTFECGEVIEHSRQEFQP